MPVRHGASLLVFTTVLPSRKLRTFDLRFIYAKNELARVVWQAHSWDIFILHAASDGLKNYRLWPPVIVHWFIKFYQLWHQLLVHGSLFSHGRYLKFQTRNTRLSSNLGVTANTNISSTTNLNFPTWWTNSYAWKVYIRINFFYHDATALVGQGLLSKDSRSHTVRSTTLARTPLEEWSVRYRDLYLTTHNTHKRQTSLLPAGFKLTIPASNRPQTLDLNPRRHITLPYSRISLVKDLNPRRHITLPYSRISLVKDNTIRSH